MTSERRIQIQTQLLTRAELRRNYRNDPLATLKHLGLDVLEAESLPAWDPDGLEAQARTLLDKRWHEVGKLLFPANTGGAQHRHQFDVYAESFWPEGHQRHVLDAVGFAGYLADHGHRIGADWRVNLLRFRLGARRLQLHWVRSLPVRSRSSCGFQLLYRGAGSARQLFVYLAV